MTATLAGVIDVALVSETDLVEAVADARSLVSEEARDAALADIFENARDPGIARTGPGTFVHSLQLARTRDSARVFANEFTGALDLTRNRNLARALDPNARPEVKPAWAARLLPLADRPVYDELFRSELFDLAQAGRWAQFAYAFRVLVLVRAPLLRRELRS